MSVATLSIIQAVVSHAAATGQFDRVNSHEPKNAPGRGLTAAVWMQRLAPIQLQSGLATTSALLVVNVRLYSSMTAEPQDAIDPGLAGAADALMAAYTGDFTLGGLVAYVDLLGRFGASLAAEAGYLEQDNRMFRVMTQHDVNTILQRLAVLEEKLIAVPDHEVRLRRLERFQWAAYGFAVAAGAGVAKLAGVA